MSRGTAGQRDRRSPGSPAVDLDAAPGGAEAAALLGGGTVVGDQAGFVLLDALARLVREIAPRGPVLVVFDDLHARGWAGSKRFASGWRYRSPRRSR